MTPQTVPRDDASLTSAPSSPLSVGTAASSLPSVQSGPSLFHEKTAGTDDKNRPPQHPQRKLSHVRRRRRRSGSYDDNRDNSDRSNHTTDDERHRQQAHTARQTHNAGIRRARMKRQSHDNDPVGTTIDNGLTHDSLTALTAPDIIGNDNSSADYSVPSSVHSDRNNNHDNADDNDDDNDNADDDNDNDDDAHSDSVVGISSRTSVSLCLNDRPSSRNDRTPSSSTHRKTLLGRPNLDSSSERQQDVADDDSISTKDSGPLQHRQSCNSLSNRTSVASTASNNLRSFKSSHHTLSLHSVSSSSKRQSLSGIDTIPVVPSHQSSPITTATKIFTSPLASAAKRFSATVGSRNNDDATTTGTSTPYDTPSTTTRRSPMTGATPANLTTEHACASASQVNCDQENAQDEAVDNHDSIHDCHVHDDANDNNDNDNSSSNKYASDKKLAFPAMLPITPEQPLRRKSLTSLTPVHSAHAPQPNNLRRISPGGDVQRRVRQLPRDPKQIEGTDDFHHSMAGTTATRNSGGGKSPAVKTSTGRSQSSSISPVPNSTGVRSSAMSKPIEPPLVMQSPPPPPSSSSLQSSSVSPKITGVPSTIHSVSSAARSNQRVLCTPDRIRRFLEKYFREFNEQTETALVTALASDSNSDVDDGEGAEEQDEETYPELHSPNYRTISSELMQRNVVDSDAGNNSTRSRSRSSHYARSINTETRSAGSLASAIAGPSVCSAGSINLLSEHARKERARRIQDLVSRFYTNAYCLIRPSGNPVHSSGLVDLFSGELILQNVTLVSIDSVQILSRGRAAVVVYTTDQVFTFRGKRNADRAVMTMVIESSPSGTLRIAHEHRTTGRPIPKESRWSEN